MISISVSPRGKSHHLVPMQHLLLYLVAVVEAAYTIPVWSTIRVRKLIVAAGIVLD